MPHRSRSCRWSSVLRWARALSRPSQAAGRCRPTGPCSRATSGQGDAVLLRSAGAVALIDTGPAPEPLAACLYARRDRAHRPARAHPLRSRPHRRPRRRARPRRHRAARSGRCRREGADRLADGAGRTGDRGVGGAHRLPRRGTVACALAASPAAAPSRKATTPVSSSTSVAGVCRPRCCSATCRRRRSARSTASGALEPPYDVVKVAHHGSADQDAELYVAAQPAVALFTVGRRQRLRPPARRDACDPGRARSAESLAPTSTGRSRCGRPGTRSRSGASAAVTCLPAGRSAAVGGRR